MPDRKNPWPQVVLALGLTSILGTCATIVLALGKSETSILTLGALIAAPALAWFATNTSSGRWSTRNTVFQASVDAIRSVLNGATVAG